jgi:hypothetical protein
MPDAFYTQGLADLRNATVDWVSDQIGVLLVSAMGYGFSAADLVYDDIPSLAVLGVGLLSGRVDDTGSVGFDPVTILAAESDTVGHALVFYVEGTPERLLSYHDSVIGVPCVPDGLPLTLVCPHGPARLMNYVSATFGKWEGVRNGFLAAGGGPACTGSIGRSMAY